MGRGVVFQDVKRILDDAVENWENTNGKVADLETHGGNFGWRTREELLNSSARGDRLVQPELLGSEDASAANLVRVLREGLLPFTGRMPKGGPFLHEDRIRDIQRWIERGAP